MARLLTLEQGKPLNGLGSRFELGGALAWTRFTADIALPVEIVQDNNEGRVELHRKPVGVVGSITPWNWPVMIACWHIVPAVRAGNTVVIKPSPQTPLSTIRLVEVINSVLPPGVVNVVTGENAIGAAMSAHPGIAKMTFTGSTATGKKVMAASVDTLKRLTLELGGNDAGIVLPDANPEQIAEGLFWGAFINSGQTCACLKRLYVHDSIYDRGLRRPRRPMRATIPVGDGTDEKMVLGPIQNRAQFEKVRDIVEDARAKGGRVLIGGNPAGGPGYFYPVTLVADVSDGVRLVDEEQFGPALPIIRYSDVDEVIARANKNPSGTRRLGVVQRCPESNGTRPAARMRLGLDQQARHDPAQCSVWRRQAIGLWCRVRCRRAEGIHDDADGPDLKMVTADYIVVGGGSAGCVVVNRLSADPSNTVLLIESGKRDTNPWIHIPATFFKVLEKGEAVHPYVSEPETGLNGRPSIVPQGNVLGGGSSINAMVYMRGHRNDYDTWAQMGCRGWSYADVLPVFRKLEDNEQFNGEFHGQER